MFEKRGFSTYDIALEYKKRFEASGYTVTKIVKESGMWYIYYKVY